MAIGKKGIFFTLIAIGLLGLILFSHSTYVHYKYSDKSAIVEKRVESIDRFLSNVGKDMERAAYISGYRSLIAMEDYVSTNGVFLDSAESRMVELILNGTFKSVHSVLLENNTFINWTSKIKEKAREIGIEINLTVNKVSVRQNTPWTITVTVNSTYYIKNKRMALSLDKNIITESSISIEDFDDPMYIVYTNREAIERIQKTPYEGNYSTGGDVANLILHYQNSYYAAFPGAPSFLMRFENKTDESPYGIESLVDKSEFVYSGCADTTDVSSVDYLFWRCSAVSTFAITGMDAFQNFRLDNTTYFNKTHVIKYNVSNLAT